MSFPPSFFRNDRRLAGLAATLALHLLLLYGWHLARQAAPKADAAEGDRIEWVKVLPPRPARQTPALKRDRAAAAPARRHAPLVTHKPPATIIVPEAIATPVSEAPPARSVDEMMQQARKDIGKIDKDLRKEFPGARIQAPPDSPQIRLAKGFEEAAALAPPKWYEQAKITEIIDPGPYGRRRYRIVTAYGTFCATYESNHAPDGIDAMKSGPKPKLTNCPKYEQPATTQAW